MGTKLKNKRKNAHIGTYQEVPPGPRSANKLLKCISKRPESELEKWHHAIGHYANTGTNASLADVLTLGGISDGNVKKRWKHHRSQQQSLHGKE
mmetsp:Transcript_26816/g.39684  ORF Transcript_26816/g.39684 Transcript_26816/m.39684 type:complete len:94 (-) Transcript_26816:24-305(-)